MKTIQFPLKKSTWAVAMALVIGGCFHEDSSNKDDNSDITPAAENTKHYFVAVDGEGNVNLYKDNGTTTTSIGSFRVSTSGGITLGEMHFHNGRAFIVIQGGLTASGADIGGGVAIVDMKAAIANPSGDVNSFMHIVPLTATKVGGPSRIVHTYVDPEGEHLWLNNDGPRGNTGDDSVFVINWQHPTVTEFHAYAAAVQASVEEIAVGDGHKKSAFSHGTIGGSPVPLRFATHNLSDQTVSVIDTASRTVIDTVCLNPLMDVDNDPNTPDACPTKTTFPGVTSANRRNAPHGMDYSVRSGKFYTGITSGLDSALAIIDARADAPFTLQHIFAGSGANQIPAAGYTHASHDGDYVYTDGYTGEQGYFSIVKAEPNAADTVHQVIGLGNLTASSFDISHMEHNHEGVVEHHVKIFVPSGFRVSGQLRDRIAAIEIDHETGKLKDCGDAFCDATKISYITIGNTRGEHRNGQISPDGMRAVYPNGDCKTTAAASASAETKAILEADDGPDCKTINVIDVTTYSVTKLPTAGRSPGSIGIISASAVTGASSGTGSGGGHDH